MKTAFPSILTLTLILAARSLPGQEVYITEFMAINNATVRDEDGEYSDWIELYNSGSSAVDLAGWRLTDDDNQPAKWIFPSTSIPAKSYLLVWASDKNRATPGQPLHTNFRLDGEGEYLALIKPDGLTIATEFAPRYPAQAPDVSYGLAGLFSATNQLVSAGAASRALVPAGDIGTSWRTTGFLDSAWTGGTTGVGFDTGTNYPPALGTDLQAAMLNINASAYVRVPFTASGVGTLDELKLRLRYDDGFVAYLNGAEVARRNAPASAQWNSSATASHGAEPSAAATLQADFDALNPAFTLSQHGSAPGPTVQNANAGSTGRFLRLINDTFNDNINGVTFNQTAPGLYPIITAEFDFRITSPDDPADGFAFMLIPTASYGTTGQGIVIPAGIEEPNFANVFAVGVDVYPRASQNDISVHWNAAERQNVTLSSPSLTSGQFHRLKVRLEHVAGGANVTVTLTANINGTPGTPFNPIHNLFIPGLNPFDCRAQFGGRTGGLNMSVDIDNLNVVFGAPPGLVAFEDFDISSALGSLVNGANMLAIHGLNAGAASGDFLLLPELIARDFAVQTNTRIYFSQATPGAVNETGEAALAAAPVFTQAGGVFTNDLVVGLSSPTLGATIRYVFNGTSVTETSSVAPGSLSLSNSVLVTARSYAPGFLPSRPVTQHYTILETNALAFSSGLPLLLIDTYNQSIIPDMAVRATATVTAIDNDPMTGRARLNGKYHFHGRVGIEGRGQTSWALPGETSNKRPYNIETRDAEDDDLDVPLLGLPAESDWVLLNLYNDKTFLNDFFAHELWNRMGHYGARTRFCEVFWNGIRPEGTADPSGRLGTNDYVGIYLLVERIKISPNRVNIANPDPGDTNAVDITGGYIFKKDKDSPSDVANLVNVYTSSGELIKLHDPQGNELSAAQRVWFSNHINQFEAALYGASWRDPAQGYAAYIDVDTFVDAHLHVEFTKNIDGYRISNYFFKDRERKIHLGPMWDWNLSFGNANYLQGGWTNGWYYTQLSTADHIWLRRLVSEPGDPDFNQRIADRWSELRTTVFHTNTLVARIDQVTNYLWEAQFRDFSRWPRLGRYVWPNPAATGDGRDVNYQSPTTFQEMISQMKKWIVGRNLWFDTQFGPPAPSLSRTNGPASSPLNMFAALGTIYYTTDGSDPRLPGGAISTAAQIYSGTILPPANARIVARALHTNAWSGPARGQFGYANPGLAITEIMFHPGPSSNTNFTSEDYEYLEMCNTSGSAIDLTGMRLSDGVDFTFSPGPLGPTGAPTASTFDGGGTAFTGSALGGGPGAVITPGGPSGSFNRLTTAGTGTNRTRIAFDRTAAGNYDKLIADFDFRASNSTPPPVPGAPTLQNFDGDPVNYAANAGANAPVVTAADAGSQGSFMRITPPVNAIQNAVWFDRASAGVYNTVMATFDFRINPASGADGMSFIFARTANFGAAGYPAVTFGEEANLAGSIGLGLDIYNNNVPPQEPNANHVSLHYNAAQVASGVAIPGFSLAAGRFHRAQVIIKFQTTPSVRALVTVRITPDVYSGSTSTETLFNEFVIAGAAAYEGRAAFGARTGGLNATHDIDNVNVQYLTGDLAAPGGLSLVFLPAATFGTTGAGSTLAHYLDAPALTNGLAFNLDFHNLGFVNDAAVWFDRSLRGSATLATNAVDLDNGQFHRAHVEVLRASGGSLVSLSLTPDIHGTPGTPVTAFTNLFVAGHAPGDSRVELAARSGAFDLAIDVDNVNVRHERYAPNLLNVGECLVVVRNQAAFQERYGTGIRVAGQFSGSLDNGGEHIALLSPGGAPLLDFRYDDDWLAMTDGAGFALVLQNPASSPAGWSDPAAWGQGTVANGSPGATDPAAPPIPHVVINEVLNHSDTNALPGILDAIELHNPTSNPVDVGDWWLSDDFGTPRKYRIPAPALLPPGGFRVFYETNFNADPASTNSFALSAEGDEVYLFSGNAAGQLTGYYHGFDFGAAEPNVSFGRHVLSTGEDHFVAQVSRTFNLSNSGPRIGPLLISEVMYHPPDFLTGYDNTADEFVELRNISEVPLDLFDGNGHPWRLRDAVRFALPPLTLAPGATIVIVSFDPVGDPAWLQFFRSYYGIGPEVPIYGPYDGQLDNSGDSVEVIKPGAIDPDTLEPEAVLVDKVHYRDDPPWPMAADAMGRSLHRINLAAYGNDPANWIAKPPTPGSGTPTGTLPLIGAQPASQTNYVGGTASFSVTAGGAGPFTYQWRFNGANLPGATASTLIVSNLQAAQAGSYQVTVLNPNCSVDSAPAQLTLIQSVTILTNPVGFAYRLGSNITLRVAALGNGPVTYQWRFNGLNIPGNASATTPNLSLPNAQLADSGDYDCAVSDAIGTVLSGRATLQAVVPPIIVQGPTFPMTNVVGATLTLGASIIGSPPPFFYRWLSNSLPVRSNFFSFSTNDFLTIRCPTTVPGTFIRYRLEVTNLYGVSIFDNTNRMYFTNYVVGDTNGNGIADNYDEAYAGPGSFLDPLGDPDGDTMSNLAEYIAGTIPTDAASYLKVNAITGGGQGATLTFGTIAGRTYTLQYTHGLGDGWFNLLHFVSLPTNHVRTLFDPEYTTNRFYRLQTPRAP